jgi:glycosyltransferase involved in cell wall biosynthesis
MEETPKVSVVITAYNVGRFVAECVESALGQDWPAGRLEVIVVNDGSTDDTESALAPYRDRIVYLAQPNGGVSAATNAGIAAATGEFIATLDGDDVAPRDRIRRQVAMFDGRPELGLVHGDMRMVAHDGSLLHPSYYKSKNECPPRGWVLGKLMHGNFVNGGASTWRAWLRDRVHPIPEHLPYQDWYVAVRIAEVAEIDWVDAPMNDYRQHDANHSLGLDQDAFVAMIGIKDIPWQRWMLRNLDISNVPLDDLARAAEVLLANIRGVSAHGGTRASDLIDVTREDAADSARLSDHAALLLEHGLLEHAIRAWVRALGRDPYNGAARIDLAAAHAAQAARRAERAPVAPLRLDAREFRVVAFADELLAAPEMLAAFARTFGDGDPVSLVIFAEATSFDALGALAENAGLGAEGAADVLVHAGDRPEDLLGAGPAAVFTRRSLPAHWGHLLTVDDCGLIALRDLVAPCGSVARTPAPAAGR